ncbi:MAG TPA: lipoyl(octanoyl) transferase LipB [Dehalococcoidia bacterium]|nr:lipoyl(octanoyl) transferase LipB [Dehalococcoidia bacterium]
MPELRLIDLGRSRYEEILLIQRKLLGQRKAGAIPDTLLLTEHEPVITTGQNADFRHLLVAERHLELVGVPLLHCERGGDITYHGPGQLVAYPILDLRGYGRDVHQYVRRLEQTAIELCASYGVTAERRGGAPGVYAVAGKIASVGVFISRWVTMHGIAINLAPDPVHLAWLRPCGLPDTPFTSIRALRGDAPAYTEAASRYATIFAEVFGCRLRASAAFAAPVD